LQTRWVIPILIAVALVTSLGGCTSMRRALGMEKNLPDEFAVVSRAPLATPPEFNLPPPQPGAAPTQEVSPQDRARETILRAGQQQQQASLAPSSGNRSAGEDALLREAGAVGVDANIRSQVDQDAKTAPDAERTFTDKLAFWRTPDTPSTAQTLNANEEAERLRQAQAANQVPTPGVTPQGTQPQQPIGAGYGTQPIGVNGYGAQPVVNNGYLAQPAQPALPAPTIERRSKPSGLFGIF